jgi:hypothetical protein
MQNCGWKKKNDKNVHNNQPAQTTTGKMIIKIISVPKPSVEQT